MLFTDAGIVIEVRLHPKNAHSSILVTEPGIIIEVSPLHKLNAWNPIWVTELGIITKERFLHSPNVWSEIMVTELGMTMEVNPLLQKAESSIFLTELGIFTLVNHVQ